MKYRLVSLLVCPIDRQSLELVEWDFRSIELNSDQLARIETLELGCEEFSRDVTSGMLVNPRLRIMYPIIRGIPRMLAFPIPITTTWVEENAARLEKDYSDHTLPGEKPFPGELDVLRTFSTEWVDYDWDGETYWNLDPTTMFRCMRFVLDLERKPVTNKLVLEVGIGIGGIADYVARQEAGEVVGVDLGYAVDAAGQHFGDQPFLHIVQASAFSPPFREHTFDFVYSQGVLHHTFSTKKAFESISDLPKRGGRLYIWVYSPFDESRNMIRKGMMMLENVIRPWCWRLPGPLQTAVLFPLLPLYLIHQNLLAVRGEASQIKYGFREALHAARDRFTPRYIFRHNNDEICEWFRDRGYRDLGILSERESPTYVPAAFVTCTGIDGVKE